MKKSLEFVWRLALSPFYVTFIAGASVFVLLADGWKEFKKFWQVNT